ncbi:MAG: magnesium transporter [Sedimentisphaerales bacterium]|nr:magnesium transporter [Sedimentisphaerales bacterium]
MPEEQKQLVERSLELLDSGQPQALREFLDSQRSSDIAEVVELVDNEHRRLIYDVLDRPTSAEVLEKVDEATRAELFHLLRDNEIQQLLSELGPDDAVDLITELPEEIRDKVLNSLAASDAAEIRKLMSYSEDSAGGIMDPVVLSVPEDATVSEAVEKIRAAEIDEDFYCVYVVNKAGRFLGDVRLRLLITTAAQTRINDLIDPDTIYVTTEADQEEVRNIFSKNDLIVAPVLDKNRKLVGRITADRIIEVAEEEAAEDVFVMAGTDADELDKMSILHAARIRMTWLLPCLLGTAVTALVLMFFHKRFVFGDAAFIYSAAIAFVPMIAAISGNAGLQTSAIVVCGLATGHLAALRLGQVFVREVRVAMLVAISCGIIGALICGLLPQVLGNASAGGSTLPLSIDMSVRIAFAFGIGMFSSIMVATTLGLMLPFLFRRVGIDPAISSGPLVTTANDSISVAIYMALTLLLIP